MMLELVSMVDHHSVFILNLFFFSLIVLWPTGAGEMKMAMKAVAIFVSLSLDCD